MKWIPLLLLAFLITSCELFEKEERAVSSAELANLEDQLLRLSESIPCTNASEWRLTPMGRKACGGPIRFIAYHQSIEKDFLALERRFTALLDQYYIQNKVMSDCLLVPAPTGMRCENNKAVLTYL
jgi:hypothetical protein